MTTPDRVTLYKALKQCTPGQFGEVLLHLSIDVSHVPPAPADISTRAQALLRLAEQHPAGLERVRAALLEAAPVLLGASRPPATPRISRAATTTTLTRAPAPKPTSSDPIRWLHLSDIHIGCAGRAPWWQTLEDLHNSIERMLPIAGAPDLLLLSGDMVFKGDVDEFDELDQFLAGVLARLKQLGVEREPIIIPVPGNHDLARPQDDDAYRYTILDHYEDDAPKPQRLKKQLWRDRNASLIEPLFANYRAWLAKSIAPRLQARQHELSFQTSHIPGDLWVEFSPADRFPLGIAALNSAWMQYEGGDFEGRLQLPTEQFHAALSPDGKGNPLETLRRVHRRLLMMHHPPAWLSKRALALFRSEIHTPGRFDVCVHGHMHETRTETIARAGGKPRHYFQSPSLFGLEHYGTKNESRAMGYAWGEVHEDGRVRVWPLARVRKGDDAYAFDRDTKMHLEHNGSMTVREPDGRRWNRSRSPSSRRAGAKNRASDGDADPAPPPDLVAGYLGWARTRHRLVDLFGVGGADMSLELEKIYVPLRFESRSDSERWSCDLDGDPEPHVHNLVVEELFRRLPQKTQHALVLGDPGSGKTTALRKLYRECLKPGTGAALGLHPGTVPLFVRLRRFTERDLEAPLELFVQRELAELSEDALAGGTAAALMRRRPLLLLDGLDEVAREELRARLCSYLVAELGRPEYAGARAVVSCRYAGYRDSSWLSSGFARLHVRPLDDEQITSLIERWFLEAARVNTKIARHTTLERGKHLVETIGSDEYRAQRIKVMVSTPLLLTLLCVIVYRGHRIPRHRAAFYKECLQVLLSRWRKHVQPPVELTVAMSLLRSLAHELHQEEQRDDVTLARLKWHFQRRLRALGEQREGVPARLDGTRETATAITGWLRDEGVLTEFAPLHYGFFHLGIQEYLTAAFIASESGAGDDSNDLLRALARRLDRPWWREVALLLASLGGRGVFVSFMREVLRTPLLLDQEHALLLRGLLDEAKERDRTAVIELLVPQTEPARLVALLGLVRDDFHDEALVERARALLTVDDDDVRWLANDLIRRAEEGRDVAVAACDDVLVFAEGDRALAEGVADRLRARGRRVWTLDAQLPDADTLSAHTDELLRGAARALALVGEHAPWEEHGARDVLELLRGNELLVSLYEATRGARQRVQVPSWLSFASWERSLVPRSAVRGIVRAEATRGVAQSRDFTEPHTGARMLWVPGGPFVMGPEGQTKRVAVTPCWLGETPVTNKQYAVFLGDTGHDEPPRWRESKFANSEQPVVMVSWDDAMAFCAWLNKYSPAELRYTLPNVAQWDFAARGPRGLRYPWGDEEPDETRAWFGGKDAPAPVGTHTAGRGPFGHHDLIGNVWEWCLDDFKGVVPNLNEPLRVLRGGSYSSGSISGGTAALCYRYWFRMRDIRDGYGFRLAAVPTSTT